MAGKGTAGFHDEPFDNETKLKLKIFRLYVREWLPVFLSHRSKPHINIFDFFAGPGTDALDNPGSPLVILEELNNYYDQRQVDNGISISLHFNDNKKSNTDRLRKRVEAFRPNPEWEIIIETLDFNECFKKYEKHISDPRCANLVFIDQFGIKYLTADVFQALVRCNKTDFICFLASTFIRRFVTEKSIQEYIPIAPSEIGCIEASQVHRYLCCDYYRKLIPSGIEYHLAPFSIRNQSNVYGLMFGSRKLLGLQKFLEICWKCDPFTGEANFPIDADMIAVNPNQGSLFQEYSVPKKQQRFRDDLIDYLNNKRRTNCDLYRFVLENGFLPSHATALLKTLQDQLHIECVNGSKLRKGSYYVNWEYYKEQEIKAIFSYKGQSDGKQ